jgi:hypothetical protein
LEKNRLLLCPENPFAVTEYTPSPCFFPDLSVSGEAHPLRVQKEIFGYFS